MVKFLRFEDSDSVGLVLDPEFLFQILEVILLQLVFECHWLKGGDGDWTPELKRAPSRGKNYNSYLLTREEG